MATEGRVERIEKEIQKLKEDINSKSEELDIRQRCLKDFQMMAAEKQVRAGKDFMTPYQTRNMYVRIRSRKATDMDEILHTDL